MEIFSNKNIHTSIHNQALQAVTRMRTEFAVVLSKRRREVISVLLFDHPVVQKCCLIHVSHLRWPRFCQACQGLKSFRTSKTYNFFFYLIITSIGQKAFSNFRYRWVDEKYSLKNQLDQQMYLESFVAEFLTFSAITLVDDVKRNFQRSG